MKIYSVQNEKVKVGVTEECGHLSPVQFFLDGKTIEPLNAAPWFDEKLDDSIPPMLKLLRGDFFCAPFGASDILKDEDRDHGATSNDKWNLVSKDEQSIELKLEKKVSSADIVKRIKLIKEHPVVYQEHQLTGGSGEIPIGHHLMLKVPEKVYLSFSNYLFGETPDNPIETDPELGFSLLKYPQHFKSLKEVKTIDDRNVDLTRYPIYGDNEDLLMLKSDESLNFSWSAVSAPRKGWLWFAIKDPAALKYTILWLSDGGRKYPPFSSRHRRVIGIEEVTSYFHLGHKASINKNHLKEKGFATSIKLQKGNMHKIKYAFGLVKIPREFKHVITIESKDEDLLIKDESGIEVHTKFDLKFIKERTEN